MRRASGVTVVLAIVVAVSAMVLAPSSGAATGDLVKETIVIRPATSACFSSDAVSGAHSAVGTGVAFDGENLIMSCWDDDFLSVNDPISGALVDQIDLTLLNTDHASSISSVGALAWDEGRGVLWTCVNGNYVSTTDL